MKGKYPLNRQRLHRALLELLRHKEVHLTYAPLVNNAGRCDWDEVFPPTNIRIQINANDGEHVRSTIHELLHVILFELFVGRLDNTFDEIIVLAMEEDMYRYVKKSKHRFTLWCDLIEKKMQENSIPTSYDERVTRSPKE